MKYFLVCLCIFVKFFVFGFDLIFKYLFYLFVNFKFLKVLLEGILLLVSFKGG